MQRLITQVAIAIQQAQLYQCLQDNQASLERQVVRKRRNCSRKCRS
uniref:Uncharacterized protein n=1 Tax=Desertifilum tharense IPPAS B-1220 TaxID=1781255 RepID=A0ACD5H3Z6_9CYAN